MAAVPVVDKTPAVATLFFEIDQVAVLPVGVGLAEVAEPAIRDKLISGMSDSASRHLRQTPRMVQS